MNVLRYYLNFLEIPNDKKARESVKISLKLLVNLNSGKEKSENGW